MPKSIEEMNTLIQTANLILEGEEYESAEQFINEMYELYENFLHLSQRVLRALKLQMPHKNSKIGLSNFIQNLFDECEVLDRKSIGVKVNEAFEYTVTQKAITDSLTWLTKEKRLTRYWNKESGRNCYKKTNPKRGTK